MWEGKGGGVVFECLIRRTHLESRIAFGFRGRQGVLVERSASNNQRGRVCVGAYVFLSEHKGVGGGSAVPSWMKDKYVYQINLTK